MNLHGKVKKIRYPEYIGSKEVTGEGRMGEERKGGKCRKMFIKNKINKCVNKINKSNFKSWLETESQMLCEDL